MDFVYVVYYQITINYQYVKIDELVKSQKAPGIVIPVKTGIQEN